MLILLKVIKNDYYKKGIAKSYIHMYYKKKRAKRNT